MSYVRRMALALLVLLLLATSGAAFAQEEESTDVDLSDYALRQIDLIRILAEGDAQIGYDVSLIEQIAEENETLYIAPLIDIAYFTRAAQYEGYNDATFNALATLTGEDFGQDWSAWFEYASSQDIDLPPGYDSFKGTLFGALIDRNFQAFFDDVQEDAEINLLEVVWGGVVVDGIPSLVNAEQVTPDIAAAEGEALVDFCRDGDCSYPAADEFVFGVSINGENRAYPLRILNWHEMFNDVLGSAPLYDAPGGEVVCDFDAPNVFQAVEHNEDGWVRIDGRSAGCPSDGGWLENAESLEWQADDWETARNMIDSGSDEDVLGRVPGQPVMLAYCTLCGSGVLYDVVVDDLVVDGESLGEQTLQFSSTGMLMRSNKLMYDRNTLTVWNALTGTPAFGPLIDSGIQLPRLPVVVTDWASWLEAHPDTTVLSLNTGHTRNYTNGASYSDYFGDPNFIMFPVWQQDTTENENKEVVFTLLLDDTPKAYPLRTIIPEVVVNDTLAGQDVTIVAYESPTREFFEPGGATVRAYERGDYTFTEGDARREVIDQDGRVWQVRESALVSPDGEELARLPGHLAFWFGWFGFYPETLVYEAE